MRFTPVLALAALSQGVFALGTAPAGTGITLTETVSVPTTVAWSNATETGPGGAIITVKPGHNATATFGFNTSTTWAPGSGPKPTETDGSGSGSGSTSGSPSPSDVTAGAPKMQASFVGLVGFLAAGMFVL
ncbi:hypothetical protein G7046_g4936 [Stylonectria norvegica]|nr:hypothetical protein G7046_g4936 [Stylonectria norvegica]